MREKDVQDLTEDELITQITQLLPQNEVAVGVGDDCAVLPDGTLLKTDCVIEGRHYLPETSPNLVGRKAVARVISDMAAMGGTPLHLLVTLGLRKNTSIHYVKELYAGMIEIGKNYGAHIVGGETTCIENASAPFLSISGTGKLLSDTPLLRSGAEIRDGIYVTGELGGSFPSEHHLRFTPRVKEVEWLLKKARPTALMDLSDGLARDLPRLAHASQVGYTIQPDSLPVRESFTIENALQDGEDYELLFTLPPHLKKSILEAPFPVTRIGEMTEETPVPLTGGWDHFKE